MCMKRHNKKCIVLVLQASVREQKKLLVENGKLKKDIEQLRIQLQEKQRRRTGMYTFSIIIYVYYLYSNIKGNPKTGPLRLCFKPFCIVSKK